MAGTIKTVGIIGAGQMGSGIAHVCALAGYDVLIHDQSADQIEKALATVNGNMARQVSHGKLEEAERVKGMSRIRPALRMEDLSGVDLAIEAATEDETVKRKIFAQLCPNLNPEAILATNTSSISITRLAATTDRPGTFHRHSLHESGSGDEARRAYSRHRNRERHIRKRPGIRRQPRQDYYRMPKIFRHSSSTASCCR